MQKVRRFNINKNMKTVIIKVNILNILKMEGFNSKVKEQADNKMEKLFSKMRSCTPSIVRMDIFKLNKIFKKELNMDHILITKMG